MVRSRPARRLLFAALVTLSMAACSASPDPAEFDYRMKFSLGATRQDAVAEVSDPLASADLARLDQLGREHLRRGAGPVTVTVGAAGRATGEGRAQAFGMEVAAALRLPPAEVQVAVMESGKPAPGTAVVTVPVWVAQVPTCGVWDRQITTDYDNNNSPNFGCAMQRNIGMMVQNPADLVRMHDSSGRDGARAVDSVDKYEKGAAPDVGAAK